jgi:hypothetical protein
MLELLGPPGWLFAAAAVVPLSWWLHRLAPSLPVRLVAAAFLWRGATAPLGGAERRPPRDPWWIVRALILVMLCLAAARPAWREAAVRVEVWVDDGISLASREADGRTRVETAAAMLVAEAKAANVGEMRLRSITRPGSTLVLTAPGRNGWQREIVDWILPSFQPAVLPPAIALDVTAEAWLVSDGSDRRVAAWAARMPFARRLSLGEAKENAGAFGLATRRGLGEAARLDVLVSVGNGGSRAAERRVTLTADGKALAEPRALTLPPASRGTLTFHPSLAALATARHLSAELTPTDALAEDDGITLDLTPFLRVSTRIEGPCPLALRRALTTHPGLFVDDGGAVNLVVSCANAPPVVDLPSVWFRPLSTPVPTVPPIAILPAAAPLAGLRLDAGWLKRSLTPSRDLAGGRETPLVSDGIRAFIVRVDDRAPLLAVDLDMADAAFSARPEYAALIAGLIDIALGRPVLDPVATVTRDPSRLSIAPEPLAVDGAGAARQRARGESSREATLILLAVAFVGLSLDVWRVTQRGPRQPLAPA